MCESLQATMMLYILLTFFVGSFRRHIRLKMYDMKIKHTKKHKQKLIHARINAQTTLPNQHSPGQKYIHSHR